MEEEKVVEALKTIHNYCSKQEQCSSCPLSDKEECCSINEIIPSEWTKIKIIKKINLD